MSVINGKQTISLTAAVSADSWTEPSSLDRLNWLIYSQYVSGDLKCCKALIDAEIARTGGRNEYTFYQKGIILREEGAVQQALELFQVCYRLNPKNTSNVKQVAECLFLLGRHKLALEAYLEAEKTAEKPDWEICHKLGEVLFKIGETGSAKDYVRRAVQLGKQEFSYALLIRILTAEKDTRSALAVSNAALESTPDSVQMLTASGILYLKTAQLQSSFEKLKMALAYKPDHPPALLALGSILQSHGDVEQALEHYKRAVAAKSGSAALWNNIGMCFCAKQKYVAAISCLKLALWQRPLEWRALYNLGLAHLLVRQYASAFSFLCAAVNLRPDSALAFMLLGCCLLELKDPENGCRALQHATKLAPEDALVAVNAALAAAQALDPRGAARGLRRLGRIAGAQKHVSKEISELANKLKSALPPQIVAEVDQEESAAGGGEEGRQLGPDEV